MTEFPILYAKDARGKLRIWQIEIVEGMIKRTTGLVDGKLTITERPPDAKRKTPIEEQVAQLWRKQVKLGYQEENELDGKISLKPMLLHTYENKKIKGDVCVQPKLDGIRMLAGFSGGRLVMMTRTGKEITHLTHIEKILDGKLKEGEFLDGELFTDKLNFDQIAGAVSGVSNPDATKLEFHCFDYFILHKLSMPFTERYHYLSNMKGFGESIKLVPNKMIDPKDIDAFHDDAVKEGHEGVVIRIPDSPYLLDRRSSQCLKYKKMRKEEFEIVGVEEAEGRDRGTPIWICETEKGDTFKARPKGSMESRKTMWKNRGKVIGEMLTVQFQEYTKEGVPRFPVGLTIRNYE